MLKFPYAIREFETMISGGYVYMDRTDRIRFIEGWGRELLFLRPRRFGKSLWLSTLMDYYDVNKADDFERLFGHLAIGQDPTPLHNQYMVMRWDFSKIPTYGTAEQIKAAYHGYINSEIKNFETSYQRILQHPIGIHPDDALDSFYAVLGAVKASGYQLYLFIDEYDHVANEVMMDIGDDPKPYDNDLANQSRQHTRYQKLVTCENLSKTLLNNLKSANAGEGLERVFMTGASPALMNGPNSGTNVFDNISWFQEMNDLCGFYEHEVANMLAGITKEVGIQAKALEIMRTYYGGSWFTTEVSPREFRLYNPTMVFYFLHHLQSTGKYPDQMLDHKLKADRGELAYIAHYPSGCELLVDILNAEQQISVFEIGTEFRAEEALQEDIGRGHLASLLCYLGILTIKGRTRDGKILLTIPNLAMQKMCAERIQEMAILD